MEQMLGNSFAVFIGMTLLLAGSAAWLMGQALAATWRPLWQLFVYAALLGCADRFLIFALFDGRLLSLGGYLIDTAMLIGLALLAFRLTRVRRMVAQYPWLYRQAGPFGWRRIAGSE
jgi:hypothetical protein